MPSGERDTTRTGRRGAPGGATRRLGDFAGAFGDLGTLLPHAIAAITVVGLAPAGVLFGFGAFMVGTGLFYGLPLAVQPMKAVSAVMLTAGLGAGEVAAAGLVLGLILLIAGGTGAIGRLARLIPQSVTSGLQLGLGLSMAALGLGLVADAPWLGGLVLLVLVLLVRVPRCPAAPLALALAVGVGLPAGLVEVPGLPGPGWHLPALVLPVWSDLPAALELAVVPQLPLTITNAVIVTAALARELFPERAARASEHNLALSSGLANVVLTPLGAMPMCHGAGGLQAQHRFGARTGAAPVLLGTLLLVLAVGFADEAAVLLAVLPMAGIGALLVVSGADLAISKRLFDARPSCWPVIGVAAAATLLVNPAAGLALGWLLELVRRPLVQALSARAQR